MENIISFNKTKKNISNEREAVNRHNIECLQSAINKYNEKCKNTLSEIEFSCDLLKGVKFIEEVEKNKGFFQNQTFENLEKVKTQLELLNREVIQQITIILHNLVEFHKETTR